MGKLPIVKIQEKKDFFSDKISTQVRTLVAAVLGLDWLLMLGKDIDPTWKSALIALRPHMVVVAILCVLVLVFDLLQYVFGYWNARRTLATAEKLKLEETLYDPKAWLLRANMWCFRIKILLLIVPCGLILFVLWKLIPTSKDSGVNSNSSQSTQVQAEKPQTSLRQ